MNKNICRCGAKEGEYHKDNCEMERCPFCGGQLISCDCVYKLLNIDVTPGTWAYSHGLTNKQSAQWEKLLHEKGLIPFVDVPILCAVCGKNNPSFFGVPDEDWQKYIIPELQSQVLCKTCYNKQVKIFPNGWHKKAEVKC